jgi:hypothetical protein
MVIPRHEPTLPQHEELTARWSLYTYLAVFVWALGLPASQSNMMEPIEDEL